MNLIEETNKYLEEAYGMAPEEALGAFKGILGSFAMGDVLEIFKAVIPAIIARIENNESLEPVRYGSVDLTVGDGDAEKIYSLISQYLRKGAVSDKQVSLMKYVMMSLTKQYGGALSSRRSAMGYVSQRERDKQAFKRDELGHELGRRY